MRGTRDMAIAIAVAVVSVTTMAIDHLVGTESERDEEQAAEPIAFVTTTALALALIAILFRFVVGPARPDAAATRAITCSVLAVVTLPLLFLAVPFPFAGAGIALGLTGRDERRPRLATAAVVIGALVVALGVGGYVVAVV